VLDCGKHRLFGAKQEMDTMNFTMKSTEQELVTEIIRFIYASYNHAKPLLVKAPDRIVRHPEWTRRMLDRLGSPDQKSRNLAVTGSKGKGSHAILLAAMLEKAGFRVGLFTSPHLVNFLERIRVNGEIIPDRHFIKLGKLVRSVVQSFDLPEGQYIGPVGILAVIASLYFDMEQTDVNVFELGRGALHDDVNQISHFGSVLTPVFLEHQAELGPTLHDVCVEKAGVITPDTRFLVSHAQSEWMQKVLDEKKLDEKQLVRQIFPGKDFCYRKDEKSGSTDSVFIQVSCGSHSSTVSVHAAYSCYAANVAVTYAAFVQAMLELRQEARIPAKIDLTDLQLPGRMQVLSENPLRMVDGAVHAINAKLVSGWLDNRIEKSPDARMGAIISIPAAKDGQGLIEILAPYFAWIFLVRAHNPHLVYSDDLLQYARKRFANVHAANDLDEAMERIEKAELEEDDICFLGTQSFVGDVLVKFGKTGESIWNRRT
jgi:dihydrofolate synthase / folylpolyglutamate synthase